MRLHNFSIYYNYLDFFLHDAFSPWSYVFVHYFYFVLDVWYTSNIRVGSKRFQLYLLCPMLLLYCYYIHDFRYRSISPACPNVQHFSFCSGGVISRFIDANWIVQNGYTTRLLSTIKRPVGIWRSIYKDHVCFHNAFSFHIFPLFSWYFPHIRCNKYYKALFFFIPKRNFVFVFVSFHFNAFCPATNELISLSKWKVIRFKTFSSQKFY